mmetsp:Transcript_18351/g.22465  ORF Transcript_18351/g.22465 Transcript_18351/m.22465 type:complete len:486 (+) Transcript_18351:129-1586(+)
MLLSYLTFVGLRIFLFLYQTRQMQQASSYTIVIGLNPALQKRFVLSSKTPHLIAGNVHRASEVQQGIGGKGQDVFVALNCLAMHAGEHMDQDSGSKSDVMMTPVGGVGNCVKLVQFLGKGAEGDAVQSYFFDRYDRNTDFSLTIRTDAKLRICTTIVECEEDNMGDSSDKGGKGRYGDAVGSTELIEPSGTIQQVEIEELQHAIRNLMMRMADDGDIFVKSICVMGTMPPGCPSRLYADLYRSITSKQLQRTGGAIPLCLVDSVVGLDHLFHEMNVYLSSSRKASSDNGTNMLKINLVELCSITETKILPFEKRSISTVKKAIRNLYSKYPESRHSLDYVAITDGIFPAFMVHVNHNQDMTSKETKEDIIYVFNIPSLSQLKIIEGSNGSDSNKIYTIGAGDAVAASTLAAWEYLTNRNSDQRLDESARACLLKRVVFGENIANTAFSFGLACGTASCLEKENSVFVTSDALKLFEQMERPRLCK